MLKIGFLEPLAFINSTGKVVQIDDPNDIMKRPEDITFLRLRCTMDGESQDKQITTVDTLSLQFCLRFPHHKFDVSTQTATLLSTPISQRKCGASRSLNACFSATTGGNTTPPHIPPTIITGRTGFTSPAMQLFLSTKNDPTKVKRGYYGLLSYLDSQENFNDTFGLNSRVLPMKPCGFDTSNVQDLLRDFGDKCRLDIFCTFVWSIT